jgi:outer membrane receptor protein involved in Fe transport
LEGRGTKSDIDPASGLAAPGVQLDPRFSDTLIGGKVVLEHDLGDHQLAFASLTRGYKAGGINVDARIDPAVDPLTYATETLWSYEAGLRGSWFGQRLTGDLTGFYLQRQTTQVRDSAGFGGSYRFFTDNAEHSEVYGLEAAARFALTRQWALRGTLALMQSHLDPFTLANGNTGGGRELANTPRYGYTLGVDYRADRGFFAALELVARAQQFDSNNQNEARRAFRVINASLGYAGERWTLMFWAKNLLDEAYDKRVFFFGNADPDYLATRYADRADPRQLGATVAYRF